MTNVWVMVISHRHGDDMGIYATRTGADRALADYCRQWWNHEINVEENPCPSEDDICVSRYFDLVDDESATIAEHEVEE